MEFEKPEVEIIEIDLASVISTSGGDGGHCTNEAYETDGIDCEETAPAMCGGNS